MASKTSPAKGFKALRDALLLRTGKSRQWLSAEVAKRTGRMAMSVNIAQATVAHDHGLRIDRYLADGDLREVQQALRDLAQAGGRTAKASGAASTSNGSRPTARAAKRSEPAGRAINFKGAKVAISDPFLPAPKLAEARAMANVYPLLYVLENSIREVIRRVMAAQFGDHWWDTQITGKLNNVHAKVAGRQKTEKSNSWHQRRGAHPIDYTDFEDLLVIAQSKPDLFFPTLLSDRDWFQQFFRELKPSRNVVCHMNPLSKTNEADIGLKLKRWEEHLKSRRAELEAAMTPVKPAAAR